MIRSTTFAVALLLLMGAGPAWAGYWWADDLLPSPTYTEREEEVVMFDYYGMTTILARNIQFGDLSGQMSMPDDGGYHVDSFFDLFVEVSIDGGPWTLMGTAGHGTFEFVAGVAGDVTEYDAEMTLLEDVGGGLPAGVMIRESPTRASRGETVLEDLGGGGGGGGYHIDSFFDIFTELSLDGGTNWTPVAARSLNGGLDWQTGEYPLHIEGSPEPATLSLLALGGLAALLRRRRR